VRAAAAAAPPARREAGRAVSPGKLIRDSLGLAFSQYLVRVSLMARGILAARLLGPQAYGAWSGLSLLLDYGVLAPIGTMQGLDQAAPGEIAGGDRERLRRLGRAALFNTLLASAAFAICLLLYFGSSAGGIMSFWGLSGVALMLGCVVLTNVSNYHLSLQRSHGDIAVVSGWSAVQGVLGTLLGLGLIPWLGAWALLWGWLAATAAALIVARSRARGRVPMIPAPSRESIGLLVTGLPLFLYGGSLIVMRSLDRLMVLRFLGTRELGYYSLSVMALALLLYVSDSLTYVLYPRMVRRFHEAGRRPEAIRGMWLRAVRVLTIVIPGLCAIAFLFAREIVIQVLPSFLPGVTPVRVMCFAAAGLALASLSSITLMTLGRQRVLIPIALGAVAVVAAVDFAVLRAGLGIVGVAWGTLGTYLGLGAVMHQAATQALGVALWERLGRLVRAFTPLAIGVALVWGLSRLVPGGYGSSAAQRWIHAVVCLVLFVPLYGLATAPLLRGLGFRAALIELDLPGTRMLLGRWGYRGQGGSPDPLAGDPPGDVGGPR
jgi:O-antigen/teichoic acid export membrane protein